MSGARPSARIVAITREAGLRRHLQRLSSATGEETSVIDAADQLQPGVQPALVFVDARGISDTQALLRRLPQGHLMFLTTQDGIYEQMSLLADPRVVSLVAYDEKFDATGWVVAAAKALRGEIYGVERYFNWGVHTETHKVKDYEEKSATIERLKQFAQVAGYRGPVRERIQGVTDELLMNALYHAPVDQKGKALYREIPRGGISRVPLAAPVMVQYASDGESFAVGVRDRFGSVNRETLVSYLTRAASGQADIEQKASGAGLGLTMVMRSTSRLVFNLSAGKSLEVIALFDYELGGKHARAIHVFSPGQNASIERPPAVLETGEVLDATPPPIGGMEAPQRAASAREGGGGGVGKVLLGVLLGAGLAAGGAYVAKDELVPLVIPARVSLTSDPAGAEVLVDGKRSGRNTPTELPLPSGSKRLGLRKAGYRDVDINVRRLVGETELRVPLTPDGAASPPPPPPAPAPAPKKPR
jgi:hypothetical protein